MALEKLLMNPFCESVMPKRKFGLPGKVCK